MAGCLGPANSTFGRTDRCLWHDKVNKVGLEHLAENFEVQGKHFLFIITQEAIAEYSRVTEK